MNPILGEQTQTFPLQRMANGSPHKQRNVLRVCSLACGEGKWAYILTQVSIHTFKLGLRESVCNQIQARPSQSLNLTFLQPLATFGTASTNAMTRGSKKEKSDFSNRSASKTV